MFTLLTEVVVEEYLAKEDLPMESFKDIQQKEFEHLTGEIGALGRRLVELGWS